MNAESAVSVYVNGKYAVSGGAGPFGGRRPGGHSVYIHNVYIRDELTQSMNNC